MLPIQTNESKMNFMFKYNSQCRLARQLTHRVEQLYKVIYETLKHDYANQTYHILNIIYKTRAKFNRNRCKYYINVCQTANPNKSFELLPLC